MQERGCIGREGGAGEGKGEEEKGDKGGCGEGEGDDRRWRMLMTTISNHRGFFHRLA